MCQVEWLQGSRIMVAAVGELRYQAGPLCSHLPDWASFLIEAGQFAVRSRRTDRRLVIGISVPSRRFAAALCAVGVATEAYIDPEGQDAREHFEWLASLPSGTPLRFRHGVHLHCGEFLGVETVAGNECLAIRMDGKYLRRWDMSADIQPLEPDEEFVRRRTLVANPDFVAGVLPGVDPLVHASHTSLDCLIVGTRPGLQADIVEETFAVVADGKNVPGVLNDILRCDAFENNANDHDRTTVVSPYADAVDERLREGVPPAVVFDGAHAFLRMRSHWRRSPWLVILDRTATAATAAADAFNQELAMSLEDGDLSGLGPVPAGVEVCSFVEAVR
jgi:hypothetical protein